MIVCFSFALCLQRFVQKLWKQYSCFPTFLYKSLKGKNKKAKGKQCHFNNSKQ